VISHHWLYLIIPVAIFGAGIAVALYQRGQADKKRLVSPTPAVVLQAASDEVPNMSATASFDDRWKQWQQRLAAAGHEAELAAEFEALVLADPARVLNLARQEQDPMRREHLMKMVLLLWSDADSGAAAAEVHHLRPDERSAAVAAVLAGSLKDVAVTVQLAREFCRDDPELALEHGYTLVNILGKTGNFRAAVDFAAETTGGVESEDANKWLKAAYAQWAAQDPAAALAAINELTRPSLRFEALDSVATHRIGIDPAGLAEALRRFPAGEDRNLVLGHALRTWVTRDVKTASQWLNQQEPNSDLDAGASAVATATQGQMLNQSPEVALSWAESIVGPELRSRTLAAVVAKWATQEPKLARRYVESSVHLLPTDRAELLSGLPGRAGHSN